jgi:FkbM family methyltransferase
MSLYQTLTFITRHPFNRGRSLSSIIRYVKWQVGSRLVPGAIVYDWANGSKFLVKHGEKGLTGNIYTGLHEFSDMGFLLHFLRPDDLFVDVGANVGSYTILACSAIQSRGIAFEPVPSTYARLVENIRINQAEDRVACINKGVGAGQEAVVFSSHSDTTNHVIASGEQCENTITVESTSLDAALIGENPSLIKIDVEGFETRVLEGAQEVLRNHALNAVIMELNGSGARYGFDESRILDLMHRKGFGKYSYDPLSRNLLRLEGRNAGVGNTLFIRNRSFAEARVKSAPSVTVHGRQL